MIDYALKFTDEQHGRSVLFSCPDGSAEAMPLYDAVDVIGVIQRPTGQVLHTDNGPAPVLEALPGWHANVRHRAPAPELEPYLVQPRAPVRVWA